MPPLSAPRQGSPVLVKRRPVGFSRWPASRTTRRFGLQPVLFASSPWQIIRDAVRRSTPRASQDEALAFVDQAEDYLRAATDTATVATQPVLTYYSFLNLAKAFLLSTRTLSAIPKAKHGLSEQLPAGGTELEDAYLEAFRTRPSATTINVFDKLHLASTGHPLRNRRVVLDVRNILPQILQGHRLWCSAKGSRERFISVEEVGLHHDASTRRMWVRLLLFDDDLTRLGVSGRSLLVESGLSTRFREVACSTIIDGRRLRNFEAKSTIQYTGRPADKLQDLVQSIRDDLWSNVTSVPPYRKYYVHLSPRAETNSRLHQLLSIYALFYYLGSVTRYRPQRFYEIMIGIHGTQLHEVLLNIPQQFLYLIASEFAKQDVAHAAII